MGTLLNYLEKYGKYTFQEMPMTDVDSLALCQLAYLKFDGMVPGAEDGMPGVPGAGGGLHVGAGASEMGASGASGAEAFEVKVSGAEASGAEASRAEASKVETSGVETSKAGASEGMGSETETAAEAEAEVSKGFPEEPSERPGVTLESLKEHPDFEKLFADVRYEKPNRALYERMVQGSASGTWN